MRARAPTSRAAHATAWPWLPALAATTPAARCSSLSAATRGTAPRTLNEPVRWRVSALRTTSRFVSLENVSEPYTGVTRATSASPRRAASNSMSVGPVVSVAIAVILSMNVEDLLHDLAHGRQRVELSALDLVEQAPQLGVARDRALEMRLRAGGGNREDLAGEVFAAPLLEQPLLLEKGAVRFDFLPQLGHVLASRRLRQHDRRSPHSLAVELKHASHLVQHRLRRRMIRLIDRDHVRDLHDPRLQRLNRVAGARHQHEQDGVGDADHLDLALACTDGLQEDQLLAGGIEDEQRLQGRFGEAAEVAASPHRANENLG